MICDPYPYTCNMTTLNACMPPWYFENGFRSMTEKLKDPEFREKLRAEMENPETPYDNYYLNAGGWKGVYVYSSPKTPQAEGKFITEYAEEIGKDPWEAFFDLCVANNCETGGVYSSMCDEDVCEIIQDPYCVVGSDGLTRSWKEKGHPRASGTFPHAITYFVKEKKSVTLAAALDSGTASLDDVYYAGPTLEIGGGEVSNYGDYDYGEPTLKEAFALSSNTVFGQLGVEVGPDLLVSYANAFGFGRNLGQDFTSLASLMPVPSEMTRALCGIRRRGLKRYRRFLEVRRRVRFRRISPKTTRREQSLPIPNPARFATAKLCSPRSFPAKRRVRKVRRRSRARMILFRRQNSYRDAFCQKEPTIFLKT